MPSRQDPRETLRSAALAEFQVEDAVTGASLGHLNDLALTSFRLVSERPVAVGIKKTVRLRVPESYGLEEPLEVEVECRWVRAATTGPGYLSGLDFSSAELARVQDALEVILRKLP